LKLGIDKSVKADGVSVQCEVVDAAVKTVDKSNTSASDVDGGMRKFPATS